MAKQIKVVKVYGKIEKFENECNELLKDGFELVPNSFTIFKPAHINGEHYICLFI